MTKRDDGRLEAEGVIFDPPGYASQVGQPTVDAIFGVIFKRLPPPASPQEAFVRRLYWDGRPRFLVLKTCDDCGALYLDARSIRYRRGARRCPTCFARQRYRYVQRARQIDRSYAKKKWRPACAHCGAPVVGRSDRKFCSDKCRVAAHRADHR
ncbi:hypothetical protein [Roseiarcus sp.]|uniref:hypothetical protein n=1 Tax=Roseiarcus sp. TaxID=1969460 RepID=UPI003F962531